MQEGLNPFHHRRDMPALRRAARRVAAELQWFEVPPLAVPPANAWEERGKGVRAAIPLSSLAAAVTPWTLRPRQTDDPDMARGRRPEYALIDTADGRRSAASGSNFHQPGAAGQPSRFVYCTRFAAGPNTHDTVD